MNSVQKTRLGSPNKILFIILKYGKIMVNLEASFSSNGVLQVNISKIVHSTEQAKKGLGLNSRVYVYVLL